MTSAPSAPSSTQIRPAGGPDGVRAAGAIESDEEAVEARDGEARDGEARDGEAQDSEDRDGDAQDIRRSRLAIVGAALRLDVRRDQTAPSRRAS